jgi:hypothetical protein
LMVLAVVKLHNLLGDDGFQRLDHISSASFCFSLDSVILTS